MWRIRYGQRHVHSLLWLYMSDINDTDTTQHSSKSHIAEAERMLLADEHVRSLVDHFLRLSGHDGLGTENVHIELAYPIASDDDIQAIHAADGDGSSTVTPMAFAVRLNGSQGDEERTEIVDLGVSNLLDDRESVYVRGHDGGLKKVYTRTVGGSNDMYMAVENGDDLDELEVARLQAFIGWVHAAAHLRSIHETSGAVVFDMDSRRWVDAV